MEELYQAIEDKIKAPGYPGSYLSWFMLYKIFSWNFFSSTCSLATEYENLHEIVLSTFEKFMIFENLLAGSSNIPLSSMLRIEKILYRQHFLYKRFVRNLCLLILRLWHFHDFHLQALQIKHLHLHFSLPSHQQFQSSEIGKRHLYLFP